MQALWAMLPCAPHANPPTSLSISLSPSRRCSAPGRACVGDMESVIRLDSRRITSVHGKQTLSQSPDRQLGRSTKCREWPTGDMAPGALKRQLAKVMLTFPAPILRAFQWRLVADSDRRRTSPASPSGALRRANIDGRTAPRCAVAAQRRRHGYDWSGTTVRPDVATIALNPGCNATGTRFCSRSRSVPSNGCATRSEGHTTRLPNWRTTPGRHQAT